MSENKKNLTIYSDKDDHKIELHDKGLRAGELINTSLARLDKKQTSHLISKAAEEALRFEVKAKEQDIDYVSGRRSIADHIDAFEQLDKRNKDVSHNIDSDIKTGAGRMRISSSYGQEKNNKKCFVASVCYGSVEHKQVIFLKLFRDKCLINSSLGRSFIRLYWKIGPKLALIFDKNMVLKFFGRYTLSFFVNLIKIFIFHCTFLDKKVES